MYGTEIFTPEKENKEQTITTLEIAEMMNIRHSNLLAKLDGDKRSKGIIKILSELKIQSADFFQESTYTDGQGKERKCYKVTKLGFDFLANKFNGEKGIVFTALYVKRFAEMEQELTQPQALPQKQSKGLEQRKSWFQQNNWKMKLIIEEMGWSRKYLYHKILGEVSEFWNLRSLELSHIEATGYKPAYAMDIIECWPMVQGTATRYLDFLLKELDE